MQFVTTGFQEMYPLWAMSTVANGGLDWSTQDIGKVNFDIFCKGYLVPPLKSQVYSEVIFRVSP